MKQFSIVLVDFDPRFGHEQSGVRPALVLQTNAGLNLAKTVLVAPITSNLERMFSFEPLFEPSSKNGLKISSRVLLNQIRVIDRRRVSKVIGQLENSYQGKVLKGVDLMFDLSQIFK